MFKKNSIFIKLLIPVIIVMIAQTFIISSVLFVNGTVNSLDDSAVETMRRNAENRGLSLEDMMVFYWSNLDKLELDAIAVIDKYLIDNSIKISDALGSYEHETNMLYNISDSLLSALRQNLSTGVFMYFINEEFTESEKTCNGLYYRDLDPVLTPAGYSDIMFMRGFIDIARKEQIQLDSLWNEAFTFSPEVADEWEGFSAPQLAAMEYPDALPANLSYWVRPHLIDPRSALDTNKCITYSRPLFYNGRLIAMIGAEIQAGLLEKYLPAGDFNSSAKSGYMLVEYSREDSCGDKLECNIFMVTGSYIKRTIGSKTSVVLKPTQRDGVYTVDGDDIEGMQIVLQPLRLYNNNTPFCGEQWALASIGADSVIFESSRMVSRGILYGSAFAIISGSILLAFIIRLSTRPLISIANQLEQAGPENSVDISNLNTNTYEINLLCSTINAMSRRRSLAEAQLREERERYLIALESAADTFLEYDIENDSFMLYYFKDKSPKPQLHSIVTPNFMRELHSGKVCHKDDIQSLSLLLNAKTTESIEIRVSNSFFHHITDTGVDGEYYWLLLKVSRIYDGNNVTKIVGTAREITREKLAEFARIETSRRDPTTGYYNRDYGMQLIKTRVYSAWEEGAPFAICLIHVDNLDEFEAYYGRAFGGLIMMGLGNELLTVTAIGDVPVRFTNDDFLIMFYGADKLRVRAKADKFYSGIRNLYVGENTDLRLILSIGVAFEADASSFDALLQNAYRAARFALRNGDEGAACYDELPIGAKRENVIYRDKPVSVFLDVSKANIVSFVFEFFERASDIHSAINILLSVIGGAFALSRIVIYSYDADFGTDQAAYQWNEKTAAPYCGNIEKITYEDMANFETLLDENSALLYDDAFANLYGEGIAMLLCALPGEAFSAYCCAMYENGIHTGRILFMSGERERTWPDAERLSLYETAKIIAAHINIEKSNSASRAKSEFLSRISHEIRTPMNAIMGMTGIAKNFINSPARLSDALDKIDFSARHLLALINDVLEMSRIESGKLQIESRPFSLSGFALGVDTLMRPTIEGKSLSFVIRNNARHMEVIGDEYRLRQVIVNLLGNSSKFTNPGGMVEFTIDEVENGIDEEIGAPNDEFGYFRFSIKDNGIGIGIEDQPTIFKAFEQAESSSAEYRRQGTGLGLAISGSIISAMGSKIELNSKLGRGSDFFFTVKLKLGGDIPGESGAEQDTIDYTDYFSGKRVLLAEDNEINVEIASYILEQAGMLVDVAENGKAAADMFFASDQGHYDIILMDIQMPVMDGLTATRNIRKNVERADSRTVPIIAMTANAFDEDMKKSIESGMNGHITKPIENKELYELIRRLLSQ